MLRFLFFLIFICSFGSFRMEAQERVKIGAERLLEAEYLPLIKDKRLGLITNHTGVLPNGKHLVDLLYENPSVRLKILFGPEHGIRGQADTHVSNSTDSLTGLPVISLYGKIRKPTPAMLEDIDVMIFDIQDVGARYYTYIRTMLLAMEAAAENGRSFIVLDRPNPITGEMVSGPIGKMFSPVIGIDNLPVVHGMTVGELALMFNEERKKAGLPAADLHVIPMKNYSRKLWYDQTGLPWIKPSPNMLNLTTATFYPGTCLLEGTNVSEGRGTLQPFELIGAPWIKPKELIKKLESYRLPGIRFEITNYTPQQLVDGIKIYPPKFMGQEIPAVKMILTERDKFQPVTTGIYILHALKKLYPEMEWKEGRLDGLLKTSEIRKALDAHKDPEEIIEGWENALDYFKNTRKKYLLY